MNLESSPEIVALYTTRLIPDWTLRTLKEKGKTIMTLKGDSSVRAMQISSANVLYIINNKFDTEIPKLIEYAQKINKPYKILSDIKELEG